MSQHDMTVDNGSGLGVRTDINNGLQALASLSSGASAPSPSFPCQLWADTGTSRLKRRNAANSAWIDEGPLDAALRDAASQGEFVADTGAANAYVCNFVPTITARSESTPLRFKVANANTTASTINDGVGVVALVGAAHAALQGGELIANGIAWIQWNASVGGGSYVLLFCTGAPQQVADATKAKHAVTAGQLVAQSMTAFTTAGTAPSFTLTPVPAITAYAAGQRFRAKFHAAGAGSDTLNVSALGTKTLKQYDSSGAKVAAVLASGQLSDVEYDGVDFVVINPLKLSTQATETIRGESKNATTAQVAAGVDDATIVTPYKLSFGGNILGIGGNGYIKLPGWLARFSLQWMTVTVTTTDTAFSFPTTWESIVGAWVGFYTTSSNALGTVEVVYVKGVTSGNITLQCSAGTRTCKVFAIGIIP